ncbi:MAG: Na+/H+ antiporter subunit G [Oceanibaculum sp.]
MDLLTEVLISFLIVVGGIFALVGSIGLVKLPEIMTRLHAPTKATTLGVGSTLIASMLYFLLVEGQMSIHELTITVFLFVTAPITANFIAKAYLHEQRDSAAKSLPKPEGEKVDWATYEAPQRQTEG